MSFDSDTTDYEIIRERLKVRKADDIIIWMKELLSFDRQQLKKTKLIIEAQINKHRRDVIYEIDDWVWLFFRNVKITRSCKDLKDKQLELYQIIVKAKIFYHLHLSISMKHLHCYKHAWIDQSSDDAMPSLNLAHLYWTLRAILSTSSRCSALSSFISFIILLDKHIWHITSHLYRV